MSRVEDVFRWVSVDRESVVTLEAQLSRQVVMLIASGQLGPGDRLPPLRDLADRLGVNQLTVRAAYRRLEDQGLIQLERGKGTTVVSDGLVELAADRRDNRSFTIGVILPAFVPFYVPVFRGMRGAQAAAGDPSQLLIGDAGNDPTAALTYLRQLVARDVDGVIVVSQHFDALAAVDRTLLPPLVFGDAPGSPAPSYLYDLDPVEQAVAHLADEGRDTVTFLNPGDRYPPSREVAKAIERGWRRTGRSASGLEVLELGDWLGASAADAVAGLVAADALPAAIITAAENQALEVVRTLRAASVAVPGEVAVVGVGGGDMATLIDPPLTTVDFPAVELGALLMETLLEQIDGRPVPPETRLDTELSIRGTCGPH